MGPNGCGCPGNGGVNGNPFAYDTLGLQNGGLRMQPRMGGGAFLLEGAAIDLSALRSPANLDPTPMLLGIENLTSCIREGLHGR